jgi:hypothetical protein
MWGIGEVQKNKQVELKPLAFEYKTTPIYTFDTN